MFYTKYKVVYKPFVKKPFFPQSRPFFPLVLRSGRFIPLNSDMACFSQSMSAFGFLTVEPLFDTTSYVQWGVFGDLGKYRKWELPN
jgi:hypothetical protein